MVGYSLVIIKAIIGDIILPKSKLAMVLSKTREEENNPEKVSYYHVWRELNQVVDY